MPIELLIAPPATGKTHACIERIQAVRQTNPLAQVWVVVPDSYQVLRFRAMLAEVGGSLGVQVGLFGNLYHAILDQAGFSFHPHPSPLSSV